jgi:predicted transposase YbfD/YdcC
MDTIIEFFSEIETTKKYNGYSCSVTDAIVIVMLGCICGLKNISQIHQWASNKRVEKFLKENFKIKKVPCYYWLLCLIKLVKPESLNKCFVEWVNSLLPKKEDVLTIAVDGKTIRSTAKMNSYESPLHIVSAYVSELGMVFGQKTVDGKSNEIPAVQDLLNQLNIEGCVVVADALNCQKETAKIIVEKKADYLLCVKDNQATLKNDIKEYVQDETIQKTMDTATKTEKNRERNEKRKSFVTNDIDWLPNKQNWANIKSIGAIYTEIESKNGTSKEWHYYISSRKITAEELLYHARNEWSVETMHWLLDVHFGEDYCRVENKNIQQNLNMLRKFALNTIKQYKSLTRSKKALSKIMLDCLLDCEFLLKVISEN